MVNLQNKDDIQDIIEYIYLSLKTYFDDNNIINIQNTIMRKIVNKYLKIFLIIYIFTINCNI